MMRLAVGLVAVVGELAVRAARPGRRRRLDCGRCPVERGCRRVDGCDRLKEA